MAKANQRRRTVAIPSRGKRRRSELEDKGEEIILRNGLDFSYELYTFKYILPEKTKTYITDYAIPKFRGARHPEEMIFLEFKGGGPYYGLTPETQEKLIMVKKQWPYLDLRLVFQNAKLTVGIGKGKKKVTYGEWADLHGFPWSTLSTFESDFLSEINYDD